MVFEGGTERWLAGQLTPRPGRQLLLLRTESFVVSGRRGRRYVLGVKIFTEETEPAATDFARLSGSSQMTSDSFFHV